MVVLGGRDRFSFVKSIYLLDLCTLVWSNVKLTTTRIDGERVPAALERAEFACSPGRLEDRIFIFGGIDSNFVLTN